MKKQDISENPVKIVFLALGSNLGNRKLNILKAKFLLKNYKIDIIKSSSYYETESWPNKKFPKYLNIALKIKINFDIITLFNKIKIIEKKLRRKATPKNYPRTCDIDIIDYDQKCLSTKYKNDNIETPHPRLNFRNFVLIPLFEISPNWTHPKTTENIVKLLSKIGIRQLRSIKLI